LPWEGSTDQLSIFEKDQILCSLKFLPKKTSRAEEGDATKKKTRLEEESPRENIESFGTSTVESKLEQKGKS